jgi:hypothetical protein
MARLGEIFSAKIAGYRPHPFQSLFSWRLREAGRERLDLRRRPGAHGPSVKAGEIHVDLPAPDPHIKLCFPKESI